MSCLLPHLKPHDQWVSWREVEGKKVPFGILVETYASVMDPKTWGKWEDFSNSQTRKGFVLTATDPFVVIDLDHCLEHANSADWRLSEFATKVIFYLRSYTEVSPSGTGLHIWVKGEIPGAIKRKELEVYGDKRYITVTENPLMNWNVEFRQSQLDAIWGKYGYKQDDKLSSEAVIPTGCIEKLRTAYKQSKKFREVWNYDLGFVKAEGTPDYSMYDFSLARILSRAGYSVAEIVWAINFHRDETGVSVKHKGAVLLTARKAMA